MVSVQNTGRIGVCIPRLDSKRIAVHAMNLITFLKCPTCRRGHAFEIGSTYPYCKADESQQESDARELVERK